jgi:hypothetical protein
MPLVVQPADVYRMISAALVIMNGPREDANCMSRSTEVKHEQLGFSSLIEAHN